MVPVYHCRLGGSRAWIAADCWLAAVVGSVCLLCACSVTGCFRGSESPSAGAAPASGLPEYSCAQADEGTPSLESRAYGPPTKAAHIVGFAGESVDSSGDRPHLRVTFRVLVRDAGTYVFESLLLDRSTGRKVVTIAVRTQLTPGKQVAAFVVPLADLVPAAGTPARARADVGSGPLLSRVFVLPGINGAQLSSGGKETAGAQSRTLSPLRHRFVTRAIVLPESSDADPNASAQRREAEDPDTAKGKFRFKFKDR